MPFGKTGNRITVMLLFMAAALAFALITAVENGAGGNTITVDDDGGADYEKIQDAIDASEDGDNIFVYNGNYTENIEVNHSLVLEGENRTGVNLEGAGGLDVMLVNNISKVTIRNFTISKSGSTGGGIVLSGSQYVNLSDLSVSDCYIGILAMLSSDCLLSDILSSENHFGLSLAYSSNITLRDGTIKGNSYAGLVAYSATDCRVVDVTCGENGDNGISLQDSDGCSLQNVTSENNIGSGVSVRHSDGTRIIDSFAFNNSIGIAMTYSSDCRIESCILGDVGKGNEHGIDLVRTNRTLIIESTINDNQAIGIYNYLANHTTIINNTLGQSDVGIKDHYSSNTNQDIAMKNTFTDNTFADYYPQINQAPAAHLKANITSAGIGETISFDASASSDPNDDTPVIWYRMDFGDGNDTEWVTDPYFNHSYGSSGNFLAKLHVKDSLDLESEQPDELNIIIKEDEGEGGDDDDDSPAFGAALLAVAIVIDVRKRACNRMK